MKREEIYVGIIIDKISKNDAADEAYIFNTKDAALKWAEDVKISFEEMGCPLNENQIFIQKVNTMIDYLNTPIGTKCPTGPEGPLGNVISFEIPTPKKDPIKNAKKEILGKFAAELICVARKLEKYGFDGMGENEIKYYIQEFIREQGL